MNAIPLALVLSLVLFAAAPTAAAAPAQPAAGSDRICLQLFGLAVCSPPIPIVGCPLEGTPLGGFCE